MSELNLKTQNIQAVDLETKSQLAKVKKLITANNADSFALAVELVRTLGLDDEPSWLSLLAKSRIAQLVKLADSRITNLLLEIAGAGPLIWKLIFSELPYQVKGFGGMGNNLTLNGLTSLSSTAAQALSQHEGGDLYLNGLTSLSDTAAEALGRRKVGDLYLGGLTGLNDAAAQALSQHEGGILYLIGLTGLSDEAAQALSQHKGSLFLAGLTSLSDTAAQALGQHEGGSLHLHRLTGLSDKAAQALGQHKGYLDLCGVRSLSDAAARALAQRDGSLNISGLTSLSDSSGHVELAKMLAKKEGDPSLDGLTSLSDTAAEALAQHEGNLRLDGLTSLSDTAAQALGQHKGSLSFCRLISLTDAAARALAQHEGDLRLDGLTSLSDTAAKALAQHEGGSLSLDGLTSLSDTAAQALAQHKGHLYLSNRASKAIERMLKSTQAADHEFKEQLAEVKKFITANNADSFALAVELVRTLGLNNEATWLSLLPKSRIVQLFRLADNRVTNLLFEIAGTGRFIGKTIGTEDSGCLHFNELTSLSDAAAEVLVSYNAFIYLEGLEGLSDVAARTLSQNKGGVSLSDKARQAVERVTQAIDRPTTL